VSVTVAGAIGAAIDRVEGRAKVTGQAKYAYEYHQDEVAYAAIIASTIAKGTVRNVDAAAVLGLPGVRAVLWHGNAPRLHDVSDGELEVLQSDKVSYRGQIVGVVIADSYETARQAERMVAVEYAPESHDVLLKADHPGLYKPEKVNPNYAPDTEEGDFDAAFAGAEVTVDCTYETPAEHNNPMEPHATLAVWHEDGAITLYDSNQGVVNVKNTVAKAFGLEPDQVRVISPHVGGGFGSKGTPRPHVILAIMASQAVKRPVKLAVTRQQMFALTGYRTPTIQRMRLGADRQGRLTAICHDAIIQSSTVREFAEQAALPSRMMYAAPNRRTTHRLVRLDVPTPSWMRAPGETPGMYAVESAMDELAIACGIDPIELRALNDPEVDPETGNRFSSRNLVACLREGAERFGWSSRDPQPASRRDGRWLIGTGVASSTYPARRQPSSARARYEPDGGRYTIQIAAADIGTGARTSRPTPLRWESRRSRCRSVTRASPRRSWPAARWEIRRGAPPWSRHVASSARVWPIWTPPTTMPRSRSRSTQRRRWPRPPRSRWPSTASAPNSWRCASMSTPARCASLARSACSRSGGSSTPRPRGRSSSAG
jgi:xanthine dehydrogenase YagR molybdenum-binding subunit